MRNTEKITIAIPVYERIDYYIIDAIESALNQTVKCKVLVVDNGSSHNFFKDECEKRNVPFYKNTENIGMFPNWNKCFEFADTDFVMLLGDDDILNEHYVEYFIESLTQYPDIDTYFSDFSLQYLNSNKIIGHSHTLPFGYMENSNLILEYGAKFGLGFPVITSAIKKSVFSGFYTGYHASNDWLWAYSNLHNLTVYGDKRLLLKYGQHENNNSRIPETLCKLILSWAYIQEICVSRNLTKINLINTSNSRVKYLLWYLKAVSPDELIKQFIQSNSIYGDYLRTKLKENSVLKLYYALPKQFSFFIFKIMLKLRVLVNNN